MNAGIPAHVLVMKYARTHRVHIPVENQIQVYYIGSIQNTRGSALLTNMMIDVHFARICWGLKLIKKAQINLLKNRHN